MTGLISTTYKTVVEAYNVVRYNLPISVRPATAESLKEVRAYYFSNTNHLKGYADAIYKNNEYQTYWNEFYDLCPIKADEGSLTS